MTKKLKKTHIFRRLKKVGSKDLAQRYCGELRGGVRSGGKVAEKSFFSPLLTVAITEMVNYIILNAIKNNQMTEYIKIKRCYHENCMVQKSHFS